MLGKLSQPVRQEISPSVVVSEVFGPTLQGEGPSLGMRAAFVRLGGCNLHCSWCDTPYTWDAMRYDLRTELERRPVDSIVEAIAAMEPYVIVVTGGEPLLWQTSNGWAPLIRGLAAIADVEIETNGTKVPDGSMPVRRFNVSPKLAHGGDSFRDRIVPAALRAFGELARNGRATLKVVVRTPNDVVQAAQLARWAGFPLRCSYVMPEGTDVPTLAERHRALADVAIQEGLNMTTRLHVLAWGQERAR